ncbi:MAG: ABC transporter substrate-binding protein [Alphaproteobacteria bacterium]|nr:ABC transporter substrate-binding protein [Alphaproteobacteria bacterium]
MTICRREVCLGLGSVALLGAAAGWSPVWAQSDPAVAPVQAFYDALVAQMKKGGPAKARYDMLKPAVEKAFDIPGMTAVAVGPGFASLPAADQKTLTDAFERMTIANYVKNFDKFGGEKFTVEPASVARPPSTDKLVKSTLKTGSDTIPFNYRMHQVGAEWKIEDIYLNGNISQMAQRRSDFSATFASAGASGLAKKINALADQQLS